MEIKESSMRVYEIAEDERYLIVGETDNAVLFSMGGKGGWVFEVEGTLAECKSEALRLAAS